MSEKIYGSVIRGVSDAVSVKDSKVGGARYQQQQNQSINMSFNLDDANVGGQIKVGTGIFPAIGEGVTRVNGSAGIEGPVVIGNPTTFPIPFGTLNVGPLTNSDNLIPPLIPGAACFPISNPYSLAVSGPAAVLGNLDTSQTINAGLHVFAQGHVFSNCGGHVLAAKKTLISNTHQKKDGDSVTLHLRHRQQMYITEVE